VQQFTYSACHPGRPLNQYEKQAAAAIESVRVGRRATFSWLDHSLGTRRSRLLAHLDEEAVWQHLVDALSSCLYANFYVYGRPEPIAWTVQSPEASRRQLLSHLSTANTGTGHLQCGWTVRVVSDGMALAERDGLTVSIPEPESSLAPGDALQLPWPKEAFKVSPGYYLAFGNSVPAKKDTLIRFYWATRNSGVVQLVRAVTSTLNTAGISFYMKALSDPQSYTRCDAAVVYVSASDARETLSALLPVYGQLAASMRPLVPAFTLRLAPGLGVAQSPTVRESFGQNRCRLLAESVVEAHRLGLRRLHERVGVAERNFAEAGIRLAAPYFEYDADSNLGLAFESIVSRSGVDLG
jgi:hypothetical protein